MGLGDLKVGYEALDASAGDILNAAALLEQKVNDMEKRMQARKPEWSGSDSDAFDACRLEWDKGMADMHMALQAIAKAVNLSKEEYMSTEANNRKRFIW
ncbi:WXG100 family type VII secretion target [Nocardioides daejeonensis]|uniref:WXG100 family type VII secretion target n=1 Tax=Nocardioides daejeonensis TaxID=1046556 RepID=UPI000D749664|nr:WXG100 family type VII secretion target [Nocardioides daejeonensis]